MSHTPGPWLAGPVGAGLAQIQGGNREIAVVRPIPQWDAGQHKSVPASIWGFSDRQTDGTYRLRPRDQEALANARLITAAPVLLNACREALAALEYTPSLTRTRLLLAAAIAAAAPEEAVPCNDPS